MDNVLEIVEDRMQKKVAALSLLLTDEPDDIKIRILNRAFPTLYVLEHWTVQSFMSDAAAAASALQTIQHKVFRKI